MMENWGNKLAQLGLTNYHHKIGNLIFSHYSSVSHLTDVISVLTTLYKTTQKLHYTSRNPFKGKERIT